MALENGRYAVVNNSSYQIPVYEKTVLDGHFIGGSTVGGAQIGTIYPNEFYTLLPNEASHWTTHCIIFQNPQGNEVRGFIETSQGMTLPDYPWVAEQEPYHYFNSDGTKLVPSAKETINGKSYRIFTVYGSARSYRNPTGTLLGTLSVGTKLATNESSTGQTYGGYMVFNKKKLPNGSWQDLVPTGYGFVDLGLSVGSFPSNRPNQIKRTAHFKSRTRHASKLCVPRRVT